MQNKQDMDLYALFLSQSGKKRLLVDAVLHVLHLSKAAMIRFSPVFSIPTSAPEPQG